MIWDSAGLDSLASVWCQSVAVLVMMQSPQCSQLGLAPVCWWIPGLGWARERVVGGEETNTSHTNNRGSPFA